MRKPRPVSPRQYRLARVEGKLRDRIESALIDMRCNVRNNREAREIVRSVARSFNRVAKI